MDENLKYLSFESEEDARIDRQKNLKMGHVCEEIEKTEAGNPQWGLDAKASFRTIWYYHRSSEPVHQMNLKKSFTEEEATRNQAEDVAKGYMCTDVEKQEWPDVVSGELPVPPPPATYRTVWIYYCSMVRHVGVG